MADKPINLRRARKDRDRAARRAEADANAVAHGLPKAVRDLEAARRAQAAARLDAHRRGEADGGGDDRD